MGILGKTGGFNLRGDDVTFPVTMLKALCKF